MGQYLAIGLTLTYSASKKEAKNLILDDVIAKMSQKFGFEPSLYTFEETEQNWHWQIKDAILEKELILFLETFYPSLAHYANLNDYEDVLKKMKETQLSEWIIFLKKKQYYDFQIHDYNEPNYLYFDEKPFRPSVQVLFKTIGLAMAGKISIESSGGLFQFFEAMIQQNFNQFDLAKTIRVYITG
jgi:hypothetical protein